MISVSQAVEQIVKGNPSLGDALGNAQNNPDKRDLCLAAGHGLGSTWFFKFVNSCK